VHWDGWNSSSLFRPTPWPRTFFISIKRFECLPKDFNPRVLVAVCRRGEQHSTLPWCGRPISSTLLVSTRRKISLILMVLKKFCCLHSYTPSRRNNERIERTPRNFCANQKRKSFLRSLRKHFQLRRNWWKISSSSARLRDQSQQCAAIKRESQKL
jgi:hypothetical protein